jgi:methylase of polypeptide subunit release factors
MINNKQKEYIAHLFRIYEGPTHITNFFKNIGLNEFIVFEGVLSPEKSVVSPLFAEFLYENKGLYQNAEVLEIGSGSGILSVTMAKNGAKKIIATDLVEICVQNTLENSRKLEVEHIIEVKKGYLFEPVGSRNKFDVIIFNHPFFFGKPTKNNTISMAILDEGNLIKEFLLKVSDYLKQNGRIIMPFADVASEENDPTKHAENYGLNIKKLKTYETGKSKKYIYELTPK